jgi:hypothetical protein
LRRIILPIIYSRKHRANEKEIKKVESRMRLSTFHIIYFFPINRIDFCPLWGCEEAEKSWLKYSPSSSVHVISPSSLLSWNGASAINLSRIRFLRDSSFVMIKVLIPLNYFLWLQLKSDIRCYYKYNPYISDLSSWI